MSFSKLSVFLGACLVLADLSASWYWPFGDDEEAPPRLSELIEPASLRRIRAVQKPDLRLLRVDLHQPKLNFAGEFPAVQLANQAVFPRRQVEGFPV